MTLINLSYSLMRPPTELNAEDAGLAAALFFPSYAQAPPPMDTPVPSSTGYWHLSS
jgi:hypothetical protein